MSELQELYKLKTALQQYTWATNYCQNVSEIYQERLKYSPEGKDLEEAEERLFRERRYAFNKKGLRAEKLIMIFGSLFIILALVFAFAIFVNNHLSEYPNSTIIDAMAFALMAYMPAGAILGWVHSFLKKRTSGSFYKINVWLKSFWLATALIAYLSVSVGYIIAGNGFGNKITGLIIPVFFLISLPLDLLTSLFSWDWNLGLSEMWFLPSLQFLFICIIAIAVILVIYIIMRSIISKSNPPKTSMVRLCENAYKKAKAAYENIKPEIKKEVEEELECCKEILADQNIKNQIKNSTILHDSDKNLPTVAKIIWCFEKKYASSVKEAKQWLVRTENNQTVQQQLNALCEEIENRVRVL
ncbi:MAG: hypothetical protein E7584_05595 [Ruminococcaceae bacterium]|nr:hypothetical protein [Oscillospiraceae bacterium]